jgi:Uma2 family endonuclease
MATGTLISVSDYLTTSYSPDCDYVDGLVVERNMGEKDHSRLQGLLVGYLVSRRKEWGIHVFPEQRMQVKPTRFRVPDICVVAGVEPEEQIMTTPPLVCIEILSRDDRMSEMQERIDDYLAFGVRHVWVIDPRSRKAYDFTLGGMHEVKELRTEEPEISIPLQALFE